MSILNKLTEGIRSRDLQKEGDALLSKWEQTGLLEGMSTDVQKNGMARLLENQAAQLLKEASSMEATLRFFPRLVPIPACGHMTSSL